MIKSLFILLSSLILKPNSKLFLKGLYLILISITGFFKTTDETLFMVVFDMHIIRGECRLIFILITCKTILRIRFRYSHYHNLHNYMRQCF